MDELKQVIAPMQKVEMELPKANIFYKKIDYKKLASQVHKAIMFEGFQYAKRYSVNRYTLVKEISQIEKKMFGKKKALFRLAALYPSVFYSIPASIQEAYTNVFSRVYGNYYEGLTKAHIEGILYRAIPNLEKKDFVEIVNYVKSCLPAIRN